MCHWHIPQTHCLESWSDLRAFDGTVTIQQPLIAPLYKGKSAHELLAVFLGEPDRSGLEIVRDYWKTQGLPGDFELTWRTSLEAGLIAGTGFQPEIGIAPGHSRCRPRTRAGWPGKPRNRVPARPDRLGRAFCQ